MTGRTAHEDTGGRRDSKNAIFLRETRTFTVSFIVIIVGGIAIPIRLEIEQSFIQLSNDILIGWISLQYFAA